MSQFKRDNNSWYKSDGIVKNAETAVLISDAILKNETTTEFTSARIVEHDIDNRLWAIKYKMKSWPFGEMIIIIDQIDGAELLCMLPQPS